MNKGDPTFVSLFCGCGGFDLGFSEAGFKGVAAFDIDETVLEVYRRNLRTPAHRVDLSGGLADSHRLRGVSVMLSGSPCQGFSTLGTRRLDDPRNSLLLTSGAIALAVKPEVFVAENVAGVTYGAHAEYWECLRTLLIAGGYQVATQKVNAFDHGTPQARTRNIMIGWRTGAIVDLALPKIVGGTLRDALNKVSRLANHDPVFLNESSEHGRISNRIRPGQKLSDIRGGPHAVHTWNIPEVFGPVGTMDVRVLEALKTQRRKNRIRDFGEADPVRPQALIRELGLGSVREVLPTLEGLTKRGYVRKIGHRYDLRHTFNGKYRRPNWDAPAPTVDSHFGNPKYFLHPADNRGFTVREAARVQGFPDDYIFSGVLSSQYRMIGNAVPIPMARVVGEWVRRALLNRT